MERLQIARADFPWASPAITVGCLSFYITQQQTHNMCNINTLKTSASRTGFYFKPCSMSRSRESTPAEEVRFVSEWKRQTPQNPSAAINVICLWLTSWGRRSIAQPMKANHRGGEAMAQQRSPLNGKHQSTREAKGSCCCCSATIKGTVIGRLAELEADFSSALTAGGDSLAARWAAADGREEEERYLLCCSSNKNNHMCKEKKSDDIFSNPKICFVEWTKPPS